MPLITARIPPAYKNALFIILAISWVSGIVFFIMSNWVTVQGEFGPQKHPWQFPVLQLHGAAAFLMLMAYGALLTSHMPATWKLRRLRGFGIALVIALGMQIFTAYLLYYLSNDDVRCYVGYLHFATGLSFPFLLICHIVSGIRQRKRTQRRVRLSVSIPSQPE